MPDKERIGYEAIVARLRALAKPENLPGMRRFGITGKAYGVTVPELRALAREAGRNHELAFLLWAEGSREARVIASLVAEPRRLTEEQMEVWAKDFDKWDASELHHPALDRPRPSYGIVQQACRVGPITPASAALPRDGPAAKITLGRRCSPCHASLAEAWPATSTPLARFS